VELVGGHGRRDLAGPMQDLQVAATAARLRHEAGEVQLTARRELGSAGISSVPVLRRISSRSARSAGTGTAAKVTPSSVKRWRTRRECGHHSAW